MRSSGNERPRELEARAQRRLARTWLCGLLALALSAVVSSARAQSADQLSVVYTAAPDPVVPGEKLQFKARVSNVSATTPTGTFVMRANIPQYVLATSAPDAVNNCGACRFGTFIQWNVPSLAPGESYVFGYVVDVDNSAQNPPPAAGTLLTSDLSVLTNAAVTLKTASATAVVAAANPAARLSVGVDESRVAPGADLTYKLVFGNAGNSAQAMTMRATLPAGVTLISAAGGMANGGVVEWNLGSVGAGIVDRRDLIVRVDGALASGVLLPLRAELLNGSLQSQVRASGTAQVASQTPLSMTLQAVPSTALGGDNVKFKLHVANRSTTTPSGAFAVRVHLPSFVRATSAPDAVNNCGTCRFGTFIQYQVASLSPGDAAVYEFVVLVDSSAQNPPPPRGELLYAEARAYVHGGIEASDTLPIADDKLRLVTSGTDRPAPGTQATYRLTFGNAGSTSRALTLKARLPSGVSFVSATGGGTYADGWVQWSLNSVVAGFSDRRELTVAVDNAVAPGTLLTLRSELVDTSSGRSLRRDAWASQVAADTRLSMVLSSTPGAALGGDTIVYRLRLANRSPSTPTGVFAVRVHIPPSAQATSAPDAVNNCGGCRYGTFMQWSIASLEPGQSSEVRFNLRVDNSAQEPPPAVGDLLEVNAHAYLWGGHRTSDVVNVSDANAFNLALTTAQDRAAPDSEVTLKLSFGNTSSAAKTARLQLRLPEGTGFVSAEGATFAAGLVYWDLDMKANSWDERTLKLKLASTLVSGTLLAMQPELVSLDVNQRYVAATYPLLVATQSLLSLSIEPSAATAVGGDTLIYKVNVQNLSPNLPTGTFAVRASLTPFAKATAAPEAVNNCGACNEGTFIQWSVSLAPGASRMLQYTVKVDNTNQAPPPPFGSVLWSQARAIVFGEVLASTTVSVGGKGIPAYVPPASNADAGVGDGDAAVDAGQSASDAGADGGVADGGGGDADASADAGVATDAGADAGMPADASLEGGTASSDGGTTSGDASADAGDGEDDEDGGGSKIDNDTPGGGCSCRVGDGRQDLAAGSWALLGVCALLERRRRVRRDAA